MHVQARERKHCVMHVRAHVTWSMCGGQMTTLWAQLSFSTLTWLPDIDSGCHAC